MKTSLLHSLLTAGAALPAAPVFAQHGTLQVGPTVGATLATAHFAASPSGSVDLPLRGGLLAGVTGRYQAAGHWGAQLAGLFVQQGYSLHYESVSTNFQSDDNVRLNYLRLPLLATYSQCAGGQGVQLFAGPYLGVLLGGHRTYDETYNGLTDSQRGQVIAADRHYEKSFITIEPFYYKPEYTFYSRRFDMGLQGGMGYRLGNALLQVGYTLGLRNLAATTIYDTGSSSFNGPGAPYRTRGLEASLTYLLGPHG